MWSLAFGLLAVVLVSNAAAVVVMYDPAAPEEWMANNAMNFENLFKKSGGSSWIAAILEGYVADADAPLRCVGAACATGVDDITAALATAVAFADTVTYTYIRPLAEVGYFTSDFRLEFENSEAFLNGESDTACRAALYGTSLVYFDGQGLIQSAFNVARPNMAVSNAAIAKFGPSAANGGHCASAAAVIASAIGATLEHVGDGRELPMPGMPNPNPGQHKHHKYHGFGSEGIPETFVIAVPAQLMIFLIGTVIGVALLALLQGFCRGRALRKDAPSFMAVNTISSAADNDALV